MKRIKGFTLAEMIITMMLVIILSLVAMPIYKGRFSNQAKLAEGYALLGIIKDAQIQYYNEYGNFLCANHSWHVGANAHINYTSFDPVLGINSTNNKYFSIFNYDVADYGGHHWEYEFFARVKSAAAGIIMQKFNLTERNEIQVFNANTNLNL